MNTIMKQLMPTTVRSIACEGRRHLRRFLILAALLACTGVAAQPSTELSIEPTAGQLLVWEFLIDVEQRNAAQAAADHITSIGSGVGRISFDTSSQTLRYEFSWSDLAGEVTGIELHGPALPHQATRRLLTRFQPSATIPRAREGHFGGEHQLEEQRQPGFDPLPPSSTLVVLVSGGGYVTIRTTAHPDGEIRGNLGAASHMASPAAVRSKIEN